jgi:hypothetical protein
LSAGENRFRTEESIPVQFSSRMSFPRLNQSSMGGWRMLFSD